MYNPVKDEIMKRNLLLLFLVMFGFGLSAQLTVPEGTQASSSTDDTTFDFNHHFPVKNETNEQINAYWEIILDDDFPAEWETYLCDKNLCYTQFVRNCPANMVNEFLPGDESEWMFHVLPKGVVGEGTACIRIFYPDNDSTFVDHCVDFSLTANDVKDIDLSQVSLYPNPTSDLFQIKSDEYVKAIGVYNVVGKQVAEMRHIAGQTHNIEYLKKGMYLVRLMDETGQIIKTMKLSKR